jgi:S-adenosylmethionine hydrolase
MTDARRTSSGQKVPKNGDGLLIGALTDYGLGPYVALLHSAARYPFSPRATWLDIDHGIALGDVQAGALTLRRTVPSLPPCVVVAVVDPGVGTDRRAVALKTATGHQLVGPDNGLLEPAARRLGGATELVDIRSSPLRVVDRSLTFDGRDLFGPVAGALCGGWALEHVGTPIDPASLMALALPAPRATASGLEAAVLEVDHFGTLVLALDDQLAALGPLPPLGTTGRIAAGDGGRDLALGRTFADVPSGELVLYRDSDGALALARRDGSAAQLLGLQVGAPVSIEFAAGDQTPGSRAA